jgi:hypothetical protein
LWERYGLTECKPLAYIELEDCYRAAQMESKAQDALARGVAARDPRAVVKQVRSQLLLAAEPDLSLAVSLLQAVRDYASANELLKELTSETLEVGDRYEIPLHRLRQSKPQFPLLSLALYWARSESAALISALTSSSTLTAIPNLPSSLISTVEPHLKSMPNLRDINHSALSDVVSVELLQSRANWRVIHLPTEPETAAKASAFAGLNRSDFELRVHAHIKPSDLNRWLANPHLTHLDLFTGKEVSASCFDALRSCQNLITLVTCYFLHSLAVDDAWSCVICCSGALSPRFCIK